MSLKAFHIFFVTVSIRFSLGFVIWSLREYNQAGGAQNLIMAISAGVFGVALIWYGGWFLRKVRGIEEK